MQLASVRCPHCFALHFTGSRFCARCGKELELEPLLDPTDAPCPRCDKPLRALESSSALANLEAFPMHECTGCGGMFVSQKVLDAESCDERTPAPAGGPRSGDSAAGPQAPSRAVPPAPAQHFADQVRYLKCPLCHGVMNRVNFGKRSGVIVDVCKAHGVWFDRGELARAIEFVAKGGLRIPRGRSTRPQGPKSDGTSAALPQRGPHLDGLRQEAAKLQVALMEDTMREARDEGYAVGVSRGGGGRGTTRRSSTSCSSCSGSD